MRKLSRKIGEMHWSKGCVSQEKFIDLPKFRIPIFAMNDVCKRSVNYQQVQKGTRCIWQIQTTFCHKQSTTNRELMFSSLSSYFQRKVFFYPFVVVNCLCETKEDWLFATIKAFGNPDKHGGVIQYFIHCFFDFEKEVWHSIQDSVPL